MTHIIHRDVAVVGAGASGISAARRLVNNGHSVAVLEARNRVGGRTWSSHIDGHFLEIGGQWISPDQTELKAVVEELGMETFRRYREGESVYIAKDGEARRHGDELPLPAETNAEIDRLITFFDELTAEVDALDPWKHPRARELDCISFRDFLRENTEDEDAAELLGLWIAGGMLTKPAHAFSALQALLMAASAGSFSHLADMDFLLDERVVGGMQSVTIRMAEELGEDVFLNAPVTTVRQLDDGVLVESNGGPTVKAEKAILAVPPTLYNRISFDPPMPRLQHQMHQHQSMGLVIKVHAVYETPFWRDRGLSGTCMGPFELCQEIYDNTNHGDTRGTLVGFVPDEKADAMFKLSAGERKREILASMARFLGDEALEPVVYYESDWGSEEWTRGAYAASFDLGGLHRWGEYVRQPVGDIHFSCSDIAGLGYQHVDGAIRMGHATADEIHGLLSGGPAPGR